MNDFNRREREERGALMIMIMIAIIVFTVPMLLY